MKRSILIAVAATLLITTSAWAEVDGFRGMKWGTTLKEFSKGKTISLVVINGEDECYSIDGEELKIGDSSLEQITYCFWQDQLASVLIQTKGYSNYQNLKLASFEKFGRAVQNNKYAERFIFFPAEITRIMLEYNEVSGQGVILMQSKSLDEQSRSAKGQRAKQAAKTDF